MRLRPDDTHQAAQEALDAKDQKLAQSTEALDDAHFKLETLTVERDQIQATLKEREDELSEAIGEHQSLQNTHAESMERLEELEQELENAQRDTEHANQRAAAAKEQALKHREAEEAQINPR